ncbi:MAG TPA: hypothetical protein VKQ72_18305 [Aggregatilineales bacterium]|nr:hypothetical protein [Aggregatilineales bacterium]
MPILKRHFVAFIALVLIGAATQATVSFAQGSGPTAIIDRAYTDLSARVGETLKRTDQSYGWIGSTYADTSLGCPQSGQKYTTVATDGFMIVIDYKGIAYDYRASKDGSILFLCSPNATSSGHGPALVVGGKARSITAGLGLLAQPMDVSKGGIFPVATLGQGEVADVIGGPTDAFGMRWWQLRKSSAQSGWAFDRAMLAPGQPWLLEPVIPSASGGAAGPTSAGVPCDAGHPGGGGSNFGATFPATLAYVDAAGNVNVTEGAGQAPSLLTNDSGCASPHDSIFQRWTKAYSHLAWSPDGKKLLYVDQGSQTVYVKMAGQQPIVVAPGIDGEFPAAWSADGSQIAFAVVNTSSDKNPKATIEIQSVTLNGTTVGKARHASSFTFGAACEPKPVDPAEVLYDGETGYNGTRITLAWTAAGFVHSTDCGGFGLALSDVNGKELWHVDHVIQAAISPDGSQALAISYTGAGPGALVVITLSNGKTATIAAQPDIDQVAWSADGKTILYSTLTAGADLKPIPNSPLGTQLFEGLWPPHGQSFTVTLWRQPASGGPVTPLFQREGRAIGQIAAMPDNSGVVFSMIDSIQGAVTMISQGQGQQAAISHKPDELLYVIPWAGITSGDPNFARGRMPVFSSASASISKP